MKNQQDKKGSVLLLTLIITMIVLTSSVVLGTLIIGSLRRSQTESSAIIAYYAAESLMEKTLYDLRKGKKSPVDITTNNCSALPGGYPGIATSACNASAVYDTYISFNSTNKNQINKNQTAHVRLINSASSSTKAGIESIKIYCNSSGAWIEATATIISYYSAGDVWSPNPQNTKKFLFSCGGFPGTTFPIDLIGDNSYDIAIKALYNNLNIVIVSAYKDDAGSAGQEAGIGDSFTINASVDNSLFSRQTIKVDIKGVSTVSSLFDYVVYSEQTIDKNILPGTS